METTDPLKPWVRKAAWGRTVAHTAADACGHAEPWQDLPCDFTKGHPATDDTGSQLLFDGHNSTTSTGPTHLNAVTRAQRHHDGTSPLTQQ